MARSQSNWTVDTTPVRFAAQGCFYGPQKRPSRAVNGTSLPPIRFLKVDMGAPISPTGRCRAIPAGRKTVSFRDALQDVTQRLDKGFWTWYMNRFRHTGGPIWRCQVPGRASGAGVPRRRLSDDRWSVPGGTDQKGEVRRRTGEAKPLP